LVVSAFEDGLAAFEAGFEEVPAAGAALEAGLDDDPAAFDAGLEDVPVTGFDAGLVDALLAGLVCKRHV
jgi:hypothetical protein